MGKGVLAWWGVTAGSTCCTVPSLHQHLQVFRIIPCGFDPATPPPLLGSSQKGILGWREGVFFFSFLCSCHLSDNCPSSPLAFPHSSFLYGISTKDTHFKEEKKKKRQRSYLRETQKHNRAGV